MGEISQTKTSIECSLYSPIPAVDGPLGPNALASDLTVPHLDGEQSDITQACAPRLGVTFMNSRWAAFTTLEGHVHARATGRSCSYT